MQPADPADVKEPLTPAAVSEEFEQEEKDLRVKKYQKVLPCALTRDEHHKRGIQLAETIEKIGDVERQKKRVADEFKSQIEDLEREATRLSGIVRSWKEERTVEVEERIDFARNTVAVVRMDTTEVIKERALTLDERQLSLLPSKKKAPKELVKGRA